ncbi:RimJ/RimL family protein N-acetyltransferase [Microbacterium endophyticum]|uniref:RimJ/RimL family protein N-acetyltransferase n=1 Tax=Microbacterium endophyticum TaxID=1526412 RepID=A0A7W4V4K1_9MICO|nr:GNAT family N-acetyltransferase [Microbacterium endophyticum]MBB2976399.1 RimJ/RimL family protein N-acetyltransferase [Microbacterium endophyticum]NIK35280.1 RimJ/RimL family protein N-acetyltransferase [Microbacterium endophyticum]
MEPVVLHTARLVLSAPTAADVPAIFAACQDPDIQRYTTVPSPYLREHAEKFISDTAEQWDAKTHLTWAMRHNDRLVGMIGLYRLDKDGGAELGYWVDPETRGRGFVTEASAAVLDWAFDRHTLGLQRVEWRAVVGNNASARAARAVGFRYEGTRRRALVHGDYRDDGWAAALLAEDDRQPQAWPVLP